VPLHFIDKACVEDDGEGDAVLCLHGLGGTSNTWTPLMPALAGYRVIRPDLPGSGRSAAAGGVRRSRQRRDRAL
jgi:pimeloyl-ACP methyl ester carboxylesterase